MPTSPLVAAPRSVTVGLRRPGGRTSRTGPPNTAIRGAVDLMGTRPHLTSSERPPIRACKCCRNKPLTNPDPDLKPAAWFADGLSMALLWNV